MTSGPKLGRSTVLLFTGAAGSVDAITYLTAHVFTANMTGNAVLLGIAAGQGKGIAAVASLVALIAFVAGVILGALAVDEGEAASARRAVRRAVWIETLILAFFAASALAPRMLSERATALLMIISSGIAMGVQSAAVRRLKLPGIATTYITGTITALFSGLVHRMRLRARMPAETTFVGLKHSMALQAEVFLSYTIAAGACAALHVHRPSAVAILPLLALIGVNFSLARRS
jgi:uncharacterized membrane protein YoaK (UPF0700 family)